MKQGGLARLVFILTWLGGASCGGEEETQDAGATARDATPRDASSSADAGGTDAQGTGDGGTPPGATLVADLIDLAGYPVVGATISAGGLSAQSDETGLAVIHGLPAGRVVAQVRGDGFPTISRAVFMSEGETSTLGLAILRFRSRHTFPAEDGATLEDGAMRLQVRPNSLVGPLGQPVSGPVDVSLVVVDPSNPRELSAAPPLDGIPLGQSDFQLLETLGMVEISIEQAGMPLSLAPTASIALELGIPPVLEDRATVLTASVSAWSFDLSAGLWREEHLGRIEPRSFQTPGGLIVRKAWVADLTHLSWWNADHVRDPRPGPGGGPGGPTSVVVRVIDAVTRLPIQGATVMFSGSRTAPTNALGQTCDNATRGEVLRVVASAPSYTTSTTTIQLNDTIQRCMSSNGPSPNTLTLELRRANRCFRGVARDPMGMPVSLARVTSRLLDSSGQRTSVVERTLTDADGSYCVQGAQGRKLEITIQKAGAAGSPPLFGRFRSALPRNNATCSTGTCDRLADLRLRESTAEGCVRGTAVFQRGAGFAVSGKLAPKRVPVYVFDSDGFSAPDCLADPTSDPSTWGVILGEGQTTDAGQFCVEHVALPWRRGETPPQPADLKVVVGNCRIAAELRPLDFTIAEESDCARGRCADVGNAGLYQRRLNLSVTQLRLGQTLADRTDLLGRKPAVALPTLLKSDPEFDLPIPVRLRVRGATEKSTVEELSYLPTAAASSCDPNSDVPMGIEQVTSGMSVEVTIDPGDELWELDENDNTLTVTPNVRDAPPISVRLVPIALDGLLSQRFDSMRALYREQLLRVFPVAENGIDLPVHPLAMTATVPIACTPNKAPWDRFLNQLCAFRTLEGIRELVYGVVPTSEFLNTAECLNVTDVILGIAKRGGPASAGIDAGTGDGPGWVFLHEVGHLLGRRHTRCGSPPPADPDPNYQPADGKAPECGYDARNGGLVSNAFDLMGYCSPNWISRYTYDAVERALTASIYNACDGTIDLDVSGETILVVGKIANGRVTLEPVQRVLRGARAPRSGPYTLRLSDGRVVTDVAFIADRVTDEEGAEEEIFGFTAPYAGEIQGLEIWRGSERLLEQKARTSPEIGARLEAREHDGLLELSWDPAPWPYAMVSVVAGAERHVLAPHLSGGSAKVRTAELPAGGSFEISFSDGVGTRVVTIAR